MKKIDKFLNDITMYKLVLYGLLTLSGISIILGFFGKLNWSGLSIVYSLLLIVATCYIVNLIFSKLFKVSANSESYFITALILFFLIKPFSNLKEAEFIALAGAIAMASKYLIAYKHKHIFNPAAFGAFAIGALGSGAVSWWVGNPWLFFPNLILALLVIRKIWREDLFKTFIAAGFLFAIGLSLYHHLDLARVVKQIALSWPLVFFGSIMLTEPSTVPPKARDQRIYGLITGVLFSMPFSFGPIYSTPELALLIGNIYSFIVSPKFKLVLTLREKKLVSEEVYEFRFVPDRKFNFIPGQYMEWTMGHNKPDIRGNRRYFTIASSPTESEVILATRISEDPKFKTSSFKKELLNINPGKKVFAGNLSGDFLLPKDQNQKIIWIAGGIGVTPMRSQAKYLLDKKEPRDIVFFYSSRNENSFTFKDLFEESKSIGIKPVYVTTPMTEEFIKSSVPDFRDRLVYLSGPNAMVENYEKMFVKMGLPQENLVTDYFPGF